ncbi:RHS domain-containing protein [Streptococcus australis]|uniref:RHS domain-containing protein n=1 Tax=Streptococcus australis TaxID=113107 RepID=UPI003F6175A4
MYSFSRGRGLGRGQNDSYEPLAQVRTQTNEDRENSQETNYFHRDQIGIPREMTDKDGNLLRFGNYTGWGRLKKDERVYRNVLQPFRLQNQYFDDQVLTMLAAYMINERKSYEYRIAY